MKRRSTTIPRWRHAILAAFVTAGFGLPSGVFQVGPDTYRFYNTERRGCGTRLCHPTELANTDPGCRERPASQQRAVPLRLVLKVGRPPGRSRAHGHRMSAAKKGGWRVGGTSSARRRGDILPKPGSPNGRYCAMARSIASSARRLSMLRNIEANISSSVRHERAPSSPRWRRRPAAAAPPRRPERVAPLTDAAIAAAPNRIERKWNRAIRQRDTT